ncbi:hypothetical protein DFH27DRAFT_246683 [Peziza echinospora]|nr:hypothetical protein DFH27DRAFT_246683 [Peziza echinospora]
MNGYPYMSGIPPPPPPPVVPYMGDVVYEIAVPPSPSGSPPSRRAQVVYNNSDDRHGGKRYYEERERDTRLTITAGVQRSGSGREHRRGGSVHVGDSRRDHSRGPRSYHPDEHYDDRDRRGRDQKVYYGGGGGGYPSSAYDDDSDGESPQPRYGRHRRSPSVHSEYADYHAPYPPAGPPGWQQQHGPPPPPPPMPYQHGMQMALVPQGQAPAPAPGPPRGGAMITPGSMVPWQPQPAEPDHLTKQIEALQLELKKSKEEGERIAAAKKAEEEKKRKEDELKAAVQKKIDDDARALAEAAAAAEKKAKEEEEAKKYEEAVRAKILAENSVALDLRKPTHTKFSKVHLCKEALEEKGISFTEHEDSFLVHRWVDREEQNALWARTKQIRAYQLDYQKRFKEEADKAPVIDTPSGPVKIVRVGNNPPVTVPVVLVTKKAPVEDVKFRHIFGLGR